MSKYSDQWIYLFLPILYLVLYSVLYFIDVCIYMYVSFQQKKLCLNSVWLIVAQYESTAYSVMQVERLYLGDTETDF